MPHYHLNLYNDVDTFDEDGRDFTDLPAAKNEAIRSARGLMAEHVVAGVPINLDHRIDVTDDDGKVLASVPFRELITIKDSRAIPD